MQITSNYNTPLDGQNPSSCCFEESLPQKPPRKHYNPWVYKGQPVKLQCTVNNVQNPASKITTTGLLISFYVSSGSCDLPTCQHPVTRRAVYVKFVQMVMYLLNSGTSKDIHVPSMLTLHHNKYWHCYRICSVRAKCCSPKKQIYLCPSYAYLSSLLRSHVHGPWDRKNQQAEF